MTISIINHKKILLLLTGLLFLFVWSVSAAGPPAASGQGDEAAFAAPGYISVDFFFEPGCSDCARVRAEILPELEERYEGFYVINDYDIGIDENYLRLVEYQKTLAVDSNASVSMVLGGTHVLNGFDEIKDGLFDLMDRLITEQMAGDEGAPKEEPAQVAIDISTLKERVNGFTLAGVVAAGLVDGINPCAISTLVFFISLLSMLKVKGRSLLIVGISFCTASFLTYTAIGFGLLRALHLFSGFGKLQTAINILMIALLGIFAFLSFRDAYRYKKSKKAKDVTLQLPDGIKLKIHKIMKSGLGAGSLLVGSLIIGASVTALESVCTGQVYVPTLVMVIKNGQGGIDSLFYLILYNLMFMVPIVTVFLLTLQGLKTASLMQWSMRNVVVSKVLLGFFFVFMAGLIAFL